MNQPDPPQDEQPDREEGEGRLRLEIATTPHRPGAPHRPQARPRSRAHPVTRALHARAPPGRVGQAEGRQVLDPPVGEPFRPDSVVLHDRPGQRQRPDQGQTGTEEAVERLGDVLPRVRRAADQPDEQADARDDQQDQKTRLHPVEPVGKQLRSDQRIRPFAIARGDHQRMADLLQDGLALVIGQRPAQRLFLRLDAAQDQVAQFGDDVVAFFRRQLRRDSLQIAFHHVHGLAPQS